MQETMNEETFLLRDSKQRRPGYGTRRSTKNYEKNTYLEHRVKNGETLRSIAVRYQLSLELLKTANNFQLITEIHLIPGQLIKIPQTKPPASSETVVCSAEADQCVPLRSPVNEPQQKTSDISYFDDMDKRLQESIASAESALRNTRDCLSDLESTASHWKAKDETFSAVAADIIVNFSL